MLAPIIDLSNQVRGRLQSVPFGIKLTALPLISTEYSIAFGPLHLSSASLMHMLFVCK